MPRRGGPDSPTRRYSPTISATKLNVYNTATVSFRQVLRGFRKYPRMSSVGAVLSGCRVIVNPPLHDTARCHKAAIVFVACDEGVRAQDHAIDPGARVEKAFKVGGSARRTTHAVLREFQKHEGTVPDSAEIFEWAAVLKRQCSGEITSAVNHACAVRIKPAENHHRGLQHQAENGPPKLQPMREINVSGATLLPPLLIVTSPRRDSDRILAKPLVTRTMLAARPSPVGRCYTQHDDNTANQFRALRLAAFAYLIRVAVSTLLLPRVLASITKSSSKREDPLDSKKTAFITRTQHGIQAASTVLGRGSKVNGQRALRSNLAAGERNDRAGDAPISDPPPHWPGLSGSGADVSKVKSPRDGAEVKFPRDGASHGKIKTPRDSPVPSRWRRRKVIPAVASRPITAVERFLPRFQERTKLRRVLGSQFKLANRGCVCPRASRRITYRLGSSPHSGVAGDEVRGGEVGLSLCSKRTADNPTRQRNFGADPIPTCPQHSRAAGGGPRWCSQTALTTLPPSPPTHTHKPGPRFSHVGIVLDNAAGRRVFPGISRFSPSFPTHLNSPSSALQTSTRARQSSVPRVVALSPGQTTYGGGGKVEFRKRPGASHRPAHAVEPRGRASKGIVLQISYPTPEVWLNVAAENHATNFQRKSTRARQELWRGGAHVPKPEQLKTAPDQRARLQILAKISHLGVPGFDTRKGVGGGVTTGFFSSGSSRFLPAVLFRAASYSPRSTLTGSRDTIDSELKCQTVSPDFVIIGLSGLPPTMVADLKTYSRQTSPGLRETRLWDWAPLGMFTCWGAERRQFRSWSCFRTPRGRSRAAVRPLASNLGEPGSIPDAAAPGLPHVGIVPDDAAGRPVAARLSFRRCSTLLSADCRAGVSPHQVDYWPRWTRGWVSGIRDPSYIQSLTSPQSPPSALTNSRLPSSVSDPLIHSRHEHLDRRRPAISSCRPQFTLLAHTRLDGLHQRLPAAGLRHLLGRRLESSPTRAMRRGGPRHQPVSTEHSCVVTRPVETFSRGDGPPTAAVHYLRVSQNGGLGGNKRVSPGDGSDEVDPPPQRREQYCGRCPSTSDESENQRKPKMESVTSGGLMVRHTFGASGIV
ncbi:hypothetical protein PR048_031296 [Dryococelus australis]|uniref:Uncharacterized protein n=1 Tax=Dryococelus australis TaxID=614101 RepID=A0ABQ9G8Y0_9NEOP|nr:hypothetical protein PR048_031296 [Dryococelus australis]